MNPSLQLHGGPDHKGDGRPEVIDLGLLTVQLLLLRQFIAEVPGLWEVLRPQPRPEGEGGQPCTPTE